MSKVLKHNVVLRKSLSSSPQTFLKGESLPEWAEKLVGNHVFESLAPYNGSSNPVAINVGKKKGSSAPEAKPIEVAPEAEELKVPSKRASRATWKAFAERLGVSFPADAGRDDIVDLVEASHPDLFD